MVKKPSRYDLRVQFAQRVKRAREARGLTQSQVAKGLGIKQDRYKHYEINRYLPHDMIEAFCLICDVGPEVFYPQARKSRAVA